MKWNVGTKIAAAFALTLSIFSIVGVISYQSTSQLIEASDELTRSFEIKTLHDDAILELRDIQLKLRTYLITMEDRDERSFRDDLVTFAQPLLG